MDVFSFRDRVVEDYGQFSRSFTQVKASDIQEFVDGSYDKGEYWPSPLIQLNPSFVSGGAISELVDTGLLHPECSQIFRWGKNNGPGQELQLHRHQLIAHAVQRPVGLGRLPAARHVHLRVRVAPCAVGRANLLSTQQTRYGAGSATSRSTHCCSAPELRSVFLFQQMMLKVAGEAHDGGHVAKGAHVLLALQRVLGDGVDGRDKLGHLAIAHVKPDRCHQAAESIHATVTWCWVEVVLVVVVLEQTEAGEDGVDPARAVAAHAVAR